MSGNKQVKHIMLVDNDGDDRNIFSIMAREQNPLINLTMASNGAEALEILRMPGIAFPDVILLDINMPVLSGIDCLKELKKDQWLSGIPAMMYSTSSMGADVMVAYDLGASLYIVKPFDMEGYKIVLNKLLTEDWKDIAKRPSKENFILEVNPITF